MQKILTIHVLLEEILNLKGQKSSVCMIPFSGTAEGPYFQGRVLPHGVDTQRIFPDEKPRLSARYILEGTDFQGNPCRIFIENNGQEGADGVLRTRPVLVTDSPSLAWMETAELTGTVEGVKDGVIIHIFASEAAEKSFLQPGSFSFVSERLLISKKDKQICGMLYLPEASEPCPAVVISHGYNGSYKDFSRECEYFASHGIAALAFDFCGGSVNSCSSGSTAEMSVLTEQEDLEDVLESVRRLKPVSPDSVFLFGGSQGGLVSALTAASHPEAVKGMILYYPAFCIPDDWVKKYSSQEKIPDIIEFWDMTLGKIYALDARRIKPFQTIGRFDKEVLIIHGDQDDVVPLQYSRKALEHYKEARLEVLQGEGHGYSPAGSRKAAEMALRFMLKLQKNHR